VVRGIVAQEVHRIHDRHHGVEPRHVVEALAVLVAKLEGRGHRQWLRNPGRFDQQIVEPPRFGERPDLLQEIAAQRAADAAVRHLHELLLAPLQVHPRLHEVRIDVHLRHVVDDHGDAQPFAVVEHMVQERRLAGAEKTGEHRHRQAGVVQGHRGASLML
jgi:hypothetical protein